jgi:midasin (ATPase involved in ribosome maturation)
MCKEPVLLIGPTAGKTLLVETWAEITGQKLMVMHLSPETETPELIGQMHPYSFVSALEEVIRAGRTAWRRAKSHLLPAWMAPGSARDVAEQSEVENLLDRVDDRINELKDLLDAYKASTRLKAHKRDDENRNWLDDAGTIAPSD